MSSVRPSGPARPIEVEVSPGNRPVAIRQGNETVKVKRMLSVRTEVEQDGREVEVVRRVYSLLMDDLSQRTVLFDEAGREWFERTGS